MNEGWYYLSDDEAVHYVKSHIAVGGAGVTLKYFTVCQPNALEDESDFFDPELSSTDECCVDCLKEVGPPDLPGSYRLRVVETLDIPDLDLDG